MASFPNLIPCTLHGRAEMLFLAALHFHRQQTVTPAFLREEQQVFPRTRISNRVTEPCDGTVCPSNDNLHHGTTWLDSCTCRWGVFRVPRFSDKTELQLAAS
jgi:hypothetical protein